MPILILLPGLHGTADLFPPLRACIPPTLPTRTITYPTHQLRSQSTLLQQIETQLKNDTDLILLAESFSGPLALQFAAAHPTRIRAVILCCSFIAPPVPRILCYLAALPILLHCPIPNFALRLFLSGKNSPRARALLQETRRAIRSNSPLVLAHRVWQQAHIHAAEALKNCPAPILYLAATRDRLVGKRALRKIQKLYPTLKTHSLPAPHLLLQTHPTEAWQAIENFLQTLETAPAQNPAT